MKQYLSLILFLFLLAACNSSDAPEATGYGYINLNIGTNPEISVATTRAGDTDTDVSTYLITIKSGTTTDLSQKPYSIIQSTPLRFEAGTYSIIAESCISTDAESANDRWGKARYYGSQDITVVTSQTVNADIICTMQNAKVNVEYDQTFKDIFGKNPEEPYSVTLYREGRQERLLKFDENASFSTRSAYFNILENASNKLIYTITGYYNGKKVMKEGEINSLEPQKWVKLTIKATQTGKIELGVAVDSSVTEENKDFDVNPYA